MPIPRSKFAVLACALCAAVAVSGCDILEDSLGDSVEPIELYGITPAEGLLNETVNVSITGNPLSEDMSPNLQVKLINGAVVLNGFDFNVITGGQVLGSITLSAGEPMVMDLYVKDDDGDEGSLNAAFTISEYEVLEGPTTTATTIDLSSGDIAYDFSAHASCDINSAARDVTFIVDTDRPAMTISSGGGGAVHYYDDATRTFTTLDGASGLESNLSGYARAGDVFFPKDVNEGEFYSFLSVGDVDKFIVLKIENVDVGNLTFAFNYMIVRLIETTD